jgi:glycosyltransferase involved in cell wall biosynthesis
MLGPARNVRGGISVGVGILLGAMPEYGPSIRYIATHVDGPTARKVCAACRGLLELLGAILFWRCEIVHVKMASRGSFARKSVAVAMARLFRRKVLIQVHGGGFAVFFSESPPSRKRAIRRTLESADLVVALSDSWRDVLQDMAPEARIRVLMNTVVVSEFAPLAERRPEVPPGGGHVLFLGTLNRENGAYDLIEAMSLVVGRRPDVVLELGGDRDVRQLRDLAEEKGLSRNVRFLGWVRGREKLEAFKRAHVFVLPSYHEGLPNAVLEALAAGLPIVATPVGAVPEIMKDGEHGKFIEPGDVGGLADAIVTLLGDPEARRAMGEAGIATAREKHDANVAARTICGWYEELLRS